MGENYLVEKLMEYMEKLEKKLTFGTEDRDYAEEYDDLICWKCSVTNQEIHERLASLNDERTCRYVNLEKEKHFMANLMGIVYLNAKLYGVFRNEISLNTNEYDSNSGPNTTITIYPIGRGLIDFIDEDKENIHKKNIWTIKNKILN